MEYGLDVLVHIYDWDLKAEKLKKRTNKKRLRRVLQGGDRLLLVNLKETNIQKQNKKSL
jgi:hypothetical protein